MVSFDNPDHDNMQTDRIPQTLIHKMSSLLTVLERDLGITAVRNNFVRRSSSQCPSPSL